MRVWCNREGFGCIAFGWWLKVKTPRAFAMFSERYGYQPPRWRIFGWRVWFRRVRHPDCP